jgi:hypothetical protein
MCISESAPSYLTPQRIPSCLTDQSKKLSSWLKAEAVTYLHELVAAIDRASPSAERKASTREKRRNAIQIFFCFRGYHRACPALLDYRYNDLPEFGDTAPADLLAPQEPADPVLATRLLPLELEQQLRARVDSRYLPNGLGSMPFILT